MTTPHPRQSKSIAVASCTMKKCKVSIHLLVVATYIPQSRATEDICIADTLVNTELGIELGFGFNSGIGLI